MYDKLGNEQFYKSINFGKEATGISSASISQYLSKKRFHKDYIFSEKQLSKKEIDLMFNNSEIYFKQIKMKSINNLKGTHAFNENKSIEIHKHEIFSFKNTLLLNNEVKSCFVYHKDTKRLTLLSSVDFTKGQHIYAPTLANVQAWLRNEHNIWVLVEIAMFSKKSLTIRMYYLGDDNQYGLPNIQKYFDSYETALEEGLVQALNYLKEKQ